MLRKSIAPGYRPALVVATIALMISSCAGDDSPTERHGTDAAIEWGYEAGNGPQSRGSMNPDWLLCDNGRQQSPIDLAAATATDLPDIALDLPDEHEVEILNQQGVIGALDNGHTIQINSKTGEVFAVGDQEYSLVQFHFHAPSEHTVNGEHFPMEMHLVHQSQDAALAVIGVLIEEGVHNAGIEPIWEGLDEARKARTALQVPPDFAANTFLGKPTGVYHYAGSLTTPPCTEGVQWYVRRTPTQLSSTQISAFTAIYENNNRPGQSLNDRTVFLDETPNVTTH